MQNHDAGLQRARGGSASASAALRFP
jgi:hypothetical protein